MLADQDILSAMSGRDGEAPTAEATVYLYFFPDRDVTEQELRAMLNAKDPAERSWAVSHLLRYAQWEDIWNYVSREEVREIFPSLDLPANLQQAWARMLKVETPVV